MYKKLCIKLYKLIQFNLISTIYYYFCFTGCSLVWLKYSSGGREIGGSNPLIPTMIIRILLFFFFFYKCSIALAQLGCAGINLGQDTTIDCSQQCITLKSSVLDVGLTSNYNITSIPFNPPFSFNQGSPIFVNQDDYFSPAIQLPFVFCFYGNNYNQIVVGANGLISFDISLANAFCEWNFSQSMPNINGEPYRNSINGPYHDLDPSVGGNVRYGVLGTYPCRTFVVNFDDVPHYDCNNLRTTFQIVLYETTNIIEIYVLDKPVCNSWNSGNAVLGIQNSSGTIAHVPNNRNTSNWSTSNEAWQFIPSGGSSINSVQWFDSSGTYISSGDSIVVCPTDSTQYSATVTYNSCSGNLVVESDTININVLSSGGQNVNINLGDTSICSGDSILLFGYNSSNYSWNNGILDSTFFIPSVTDYFVVNATDSNGCSSIDSVLLIVNNTYLIDTNIRSCDSVFWNGLYYNSSGSYDLFNSTIYACDSINRLNLTIDSATSSYTSISSCVNYTWNNNTYNTSGQYSYITQNINGCDSTAILNLTVNMPSISTLSTSACNQYTWNNQTYVNSGIYSYLTTGTNGCDSTAILNLTINNPTYSYSNINSCNPVLWNGVQYNSSGNYTYLTTNSNGCDSIANLDLIINNPTSSSSSINSCTSFNWNNQTYNSSGTYSYLSVGTNGCDSTAYLFLTINQPTTSYNYISSCNPVIWNGTNYDSTGTYIYNTINSVGCDSIATLDLFITPTIMSFDTISSCIDYQWNGQNLTSSGNYNFMTVNSDGCDSLVNLFLLINQPSTSTTNQISCDEFQWNNQTYTSSGNYQYTTLNILGCDSVANLNLTINYSSLSNINISSCSQYEWNNLTYTNSGTYSYLTSNSLGCDSVAYLNLTIKPVRESVFDTTICLGSSIIWNGDVYNQQGIYSYLTIGSNGCDSLAKLDLNTAVSSTTYNTVSTCDQYIWNNNLYNESGTYSYTSGNGNGCDSLYVLNLIINNSTFSSDSITTCNDFYWGGKIYNQSGNYNLTTINSAGCDSIINLNLEIEEINTYLPNTFTPNNDNLNDQFASFNYNIENYEIYIFNRIGEQVFYSNDSYKGWNGKFKNDIVQDGVYAWKLKYTCSGEYNEVLGYVTILK